MCPCMGGLYIERTCMLGLETLLLIHFKKKEWYETCVVSLQLRFVYATEGTQSYAR
jgi:hypothetical protein